MAGRANPGVRTGQAATCFAACLHGKEPIAAQPRIAAATHRSEGVQRSLGRSPLRRVRGVPVGEAQPQAGPPAVTGEGARQGGSEAGWERGTEWEGIACVCALSTHRAQAHRQRHAGTGTQAQVRGDQQCAFPSSPTQYACTQVVSCSTCSGGAHRWRPEKCSITKPPPHQSCSATARWPSSAALLRSIGGASALGRAGPCSTSRRSRPTGSLPPR